MTYKLTKTEWKFLALTIRKPLTCSSETVSLQQCEWNLEVGGWMSELVTRKQRW